MPYGAKRRGQHQKNTYGRRAPARPRWGLIPLTALIILAAVAGLARSGLAGQLEAAVAAAAQSEAISAGLIRLVLPEGQSAGDAPHPMDTESLGAGEDAPGGPARLPDEPLWQGAVSLEDTIPPEEAACEEEGREAALSDEELRMLLPDPGVFESVLPELAGGQASAPVASLTISGRESGYESAGPVYLRNETDYAIDAAALLGQPSPVKLSGDGVQVLIMHTHGTEAYTPDSQYPYEASDPDRTTDCTRNVVRVGAEIARILNESGIKTVHAQTLNDYPAYNGSYNRALADITAYVKENPSIKVVIDVHRDAMVSQNGTKYKTVADIDGRPAAQLMFVAGTDQGGLTHERWRDNLTFQLQLQDQMNSRYPGIMRPVNIRTGRFNQHVTLGSMLLEVGTSGNSLGEALYSAQLFAQQLAEKLK